jgi:hypothetical protein
MGHLLFIARYCEHDTGMGCGIGVVNWRVMVLFPVFSLAADRRDIENPHNSDIESDVSNLQYVRQVEKCMFSFCSLKYSLYICPFLPP